ncbi:MAG TPA: ATP-binding protein [Terriglobia bacterium]|nr:ATP-binding protein [Terriglobia bacterium]
MRNRQPETGTRATFAWMDLLWLAFLGGLALLDPIFEIHKQLILLGIGLLQIFDQRLFAAVKPSRRNAYSVIIKILLATLLIGHTAAVPITSNYYLIYFLPVISAAMTYEAWGALFWTAVASAAYCSYLIPALVEYELTPSGETELAIRVLFFFLAAIVVNRLVSEYRRQTERFRTLAETLAETNQRLEQVQAEARRSERLAALGQLSAGLAHEIRNPLGVIKGSAEMLAAKLPPSDSVAVELAGYISSEVDRLNGMVGRFLDFARPLRLEPRSQQIAPVIERALKAIHDRWPEAPVEVERQYAAHLPAVPVDAEMCEQVFTNLASNAYEALGEKGGKLRVRVAPASTGNRSGVQIDFEDSGPGVPIELREQIFNPFFTTKKTGTGLGLSIVSKIVDEHGGTIRATGEPAQGACFRVFLPGAEGGAGK